MVIKKGYLVLFLVIVVLAVFIFSDCVNETLMCISPDFLVNPFYNDNNN